MFSAAPPVAINFNDEALWDTNFATAVAQAKALGVQSVRLWFGFQSYDSRPNAWDPVTPYGAVTAGDIPADEASTDSLPQTMARVFQLKRLGFNVMVTLQPNDASAPTSADQVQAFVRHMMDATETPDSTTTLKDVVNYWEIGNEPDSASYWSASATNKVAGLKSYVDDFLIPAAEELHSGTPDEWAKVISGGVSYNPTDLNTILTELRAQNALDDIDYAGFHAYGVVNATTNDIAKNAALAMSYANAAGKQLIATEWNVRGFGNTGANDAVWAKTVDSVYRATIAPDFEAAYYFALVNNWAARGGSTSARPGGVLKHDTTLAVTPLSPVLTLRDYFNAPLIQADPFYATVDGWQYGQFSGKVIDQTVLPAGTTTTPVTVYIDLDGDGKLDPGEPSAETDAGGAYTLRYSDQSVVAGAYRVSISTPSTLSAVTGSTTLTLANLTNLTGVNFTVRASPTLLANLGTAVGTLWKDADGDGTFDGGEAGLAGWTVYMDLNGNGSLDAGEPSTVTTAGGAYALPYDIRTTGTSPKSLRAVLQGGYTATKTATLTPAGGKTQTGLNLGVTSANGSIRGYLWNDTDGDGLLDGTEGYTGSRVVFLDANRNGKLDAGEQQVTSDAASNYAFTGLAAGTYYVSRVFPAGFRLSNTSAGDVAVTITAGQAATGVNLGTTDQSSDPASGTDGGSSAAPGTGAITGKLFAALNQWTSQLLALPWVAYLDSNGDGKRETGETAAAVKPDGSFALTNLAAASYSLRLTPQNGWTVKTPTTGVFLLTLKTGQARTGQNFVLTKA